MSFIVAHFTATNVSIELMSGAKSRKWVHHNLTNQPTKWRSIDVVRMSPRMSVGRCVPPADPRFLLLMFVIQLIKNKRPNMK